MASSVARSALVDVFRSVDEKRDNPREAYRIVQESILTFRTLGEDVPAALLQVEKDLSAECFAESQGR